MYKTERNVLLTESIKNCIVQLKKGFVRKRLLSKNNKKRGEDTMLRQFNEYLGEREHFSSRRTIFVIYIRRKGMHSKVGLYFRNYELR